MVVDQPPTVRVQRQILCDSCCALHTGFNLNKKSYVKINMSRQTGYSIDHPKTCFPSIFSLTKTHILLFLFYMSTIPYRGCIVGV